MWQEQEQTLYKAFTFTDFAEAWAFMSEVAIVAEREQHHPEWKNSYNKVEIWLTTHDAGGITNKDRELAEEIEAIFQTFQARK